MRWVGHVAHTGKEGSLHTSSLYENVKKRDDVEDVDNIKMDPRSRFEECWMESSDPGQGLVVVPREHGNDPSSSIQCAEFLGGFLV